MVEPEGNRNGPIRLSTWPTALETMPRLGEELGLGPGDLFIKRDDLSGLGGGGNKVRKLEWTVADALSRGADTLITTGAPQSNNAQLTAAAAARQGLRCVLVFPGSRPDQPSSGNLVLDALFGAEVVYAESTGEADLAAAAAIVAERIAGDGHVPYLIPFGGSSALAARGYVSAGQEVLAQAPDVRTLMVALGSGATMAGLVASLGPERVIGVDTGAVADPRAVVHGLLAELDPSVAADALRIDSGQVGAGYGSLTAAVQEAMVLAARLEGIVLDPVYTGRAMAGLIAAARAGQIKRGETTVFLHTGGLPGLFGHADALAYAAGLGPAR